MIPMRALHGYRLMRSYSLYENPPLYPSWTLFCRYCKEGSAKHRALSNALLMDTGHSGIVEIMLNEPGGDKNVQRPTTVIFPGGRAAMIGMVQDLRALHPAGRWVWASRGTTLLSLDALLHWLLLRTWAAPKPVKRKPRPPPPLPSIPPHDPDFRVSPLREDDPEEYANFLRRIESCPLP